MGLQTDSDAENNLSLRLIDSKFLQSQGCPQLIHRFWPVNHFSGEKLWITEIPDFTKSNNGRNLGETTGLVETWG